MKKIDGGVTTPLGWMAAGVHCGIKRERLDLALLYSEHPTIGACTFTQNRMRAAPVEYMVARKNHNIRAFIINSGNANAITGKQG
ncbi:MAG TPA: bifunctional ornithine acetyltransferase/N-acetylglutamate synthase, partial [Methanomassiliicoccaceae archaeon]|nr:bifunctional ornithine acetyltransferase/N-acetylglutamate synthase [Methanomassiliicoccaceae archaeon]